MITKPYIYSCATYGSLLLAKRNSEFMTLAESYQDEIDTTWDIDKTTNHHKYRITLKLYIYMQVNCRGIARVKGSIKVVMTHGGVTVTVGTENIKRTWKRKRMKWKIISINESDQGHGGLVGVRGLVNW